MDSFGRVVFVFLNVRAQVGPFAFTGLAEQVFPPRIWPCNGTETLSKERDSSSGLRLDVVPKVIYIIEDGRLRVSALFLVASGARKQAA